MNGQQTYNAMPQSRGYNALTDDRNMQLMRIRDQIERERRYGAMSQGTRPMTLAENAAYAGKELTGMNAMNRGYQTVRDFRGEHGIMNPATMGDYAKANVGLAGNALEATMAGMDVGALAGPSGRMASNAIESAIKANPGLFPDTQAGMIAGPSAKGWGEAKNKFSSLWDKKARFEIDDSAARLNLDVVKDNEFSGKIGELLDHPELYKQYPDIKDIEISINPRMDGRGVYSATGSSEGKPFIGLKGKNSYSDLAQAETKYRDAEDTAELIWSDSLADVWESKASLIEYIKKQATREMEVAQSPVPKTTRQTILHEIQHHIQDTEDFAKGGSMDVMRRGVKKELDGFNDKLADLNRKMKKASGTSRYDELMAEREELVPKIQKLQGSLGDISEESHNRYLKLAGEFEARDTAARGGLSAEERLLNPIYASEDIAAKDLIVRN